MSGALENRRIKNARIDPAHNILALYYTVREFGTGPEKRAVSNCVRYCGV